MMIGFLMPSGGNGDIGSSNGAGSLAEREDGCPFGAQPSSAKGQPSIGRFCRADDEHPNQVSARRAGCVDGANAYVARSA